MIKYQLQHVGGLPLRAVRDTWEDAAKDAEAIGVGRWRNKHEFEIDAGNLIKAVKPPPSVAVEDEENDG